MKEFIELENRLLEIINELETDVLKFVNPTNAVAEKEKFFQALEKKEEYNPCFTYLPKNPIFSHFTLNPEYEKIMNELNSLEILEEGVGKLIGKKRNDSINKMQLIRGIGSIEFTKKSIGFYGKPKRKLMGYALELLETEGEEETRKTHSVDDAVQFIGNGLKKEKIEMNVSLDENISANADTLNFDKVIKVKNGATFSENGLKRIYLHEVKTHVYRYLNGEKQPFRLFINGTDRNWQITEEGLATVNEELFGLSSKERLRNCAGRVIGIHYALKHSFYETFKYLEGFFGREEAYQLTQRIKRGMHNTERKGAFTKDFFYLAGRKRIRTFMEEGGKLEDLYYGKIATGDVDVLEEVPKLSKPKYLPKYNKEKIKKYLKGKN